MEEGFSSQFANVNLTCSFITLKVHTILLPNTMLLSAHHWVELSWWLKMTPSFTLNPTLSFCFPMDYLKSFLNSLIFTNKLNIYLYSAWWLNALQEEGTLSVTTPLRTRLFRWMKISTQFLLFRVRNRYVE